MGLRARVATPVSVGIPMSGQAGGPRVADATAHLPRHGGDRMYHLALTRAPPVSRSGGARKASAMMVLFALLLQVQVEIEVTLPTIRFSTAPRMVEAEPGILVVHDHHEEVVFVDGWYWLRWRGRWYQARDHRGRWIQVEPRVIPVGLMRAPPGHFKRFKAKDPKWRMVSGEGRIVEPKAKGRPPGRAWADSQHRGKHAGKAKPGKSKRGKKR